MDYRNADGSVAEMCGNGIRVFARYLLSHGLADGPALDDRHPGGRTAGLGGGRRGDHGRYGAAAAARRPAGRSSAARHRDGLHVCLGNPHLACLVDEPVADLDLSVAPGVDPAQFPDGVNVEIGRILAAGHLEMRVYERGSGPTLSCGTGAVAAAVAAAARAVPQGQAGQPGQARQPETGQLEQAGEAGQPGQPGRAGQAGQAGRAGQAGQAGQAGRAGQAGGPDELTGRWTVDVPGGRADRHAHGADQPADRPGRDRGRRRAEPGLASRPRRRGVSLLFMIAVVCWGPDPR